MNIQVEMPKWWLFKAREDEVWHITANVKPELAVDKKTGFAYDWRVTTNVTTWQEVKVTGFNGDWKDSLHQWNGKEWEKV